MGKGKKTLATCRSLLLPKINNTYLIYAGKSQQLHFYSKLQRIAKIFVKKCKKYYIFFSKFSISNPPFSEGMCPVALRPVVGGGFYLPLRLLRNFEDDAVRASELPILNSYKN